MLLIREKMKGIIEPLILKEEISWAIAPEIVDVFRGQDFFRYLVNIYCSG